MTAGIAEHLDHQIGGAVDHLRHVGEIGGAVDEPAEPQTAAYAVEIAAGRDLQVRDDVEGAETRRLLSVGDADRGAELASKAALAIPLADLAGDENEIARHRERHVIGEGRGRLRQFDAETLGEAKIGFTADRVLVIDGRSYRGKIWTMPGKERHEQAIQGFRPAFLLRADNPIGEVVVPQLHTTVQFAMPPELRLLRSP